MGPTPTHTHRTDGARGTGRTSGRIRTGRRESTGQTLSSLGPQSLLPVPSVPGVPPWDPRAYFVPTRHRPSTLTGEVSAQEDEHPTFPPPPGPDDTGEPRSQEPSTLGPPVAPHEMSRELASETGPRPSRRTPHLGPFRNLPFQTTRPPLPTSETRETPPADPSRPRPTCRVPAPTRRPLPSGSMHTHVPSPDPLFRGLTLKPPQASTPDSPTPGDLGTGVGWTFNIETQHPESRPAPPHS